MHLKPHINKSIRFYFILWRLKELYFGFSFQETHILSQFLSTSLHTCTTLHSGNLEIFLWRMDQFVLILKVLN